MFLRLPAKLKEPYPADFGVGSCLKDGLTTAVFVFFFMKFFQPFGLAEFRSGIREVLFVGYSLTSGLLVVLNCLVFPRLLGRWFRDENWTTGKHILWAVWIILTVGLACFVFTQQVYRAAGMPIRFIHFLLVLSGTFIIGGLLVTGLTIINLNHLLRRNARLVTETNAEINAQPEALRSPQGSAPLLTLVADNGKDTVQAELKEVLFLASEENYVAVHLQRGRPVRLLLRGSLSRMEGQLKDRFPRIFRCHRAYMVNLDKIQRVSGNAQGLRLTLPDVDTAIPVARRYVPEFRRALSRWP